MQGISVEWHETTNKGAILKAFSFELLPLRRKRRNSWVGNDLDFELLDAEGSVLASHNNVAPWQEVPMPLGMLNNFFGFRWSETGEKSLVLRAYEFDYKPFDRKRIYV